MFSTTIDKILKADKYSSHFFKGVYARDTGVKTKANDTKNEEYKKTLLLGSLELNIKYLNESYDILNELEFKKINFLLDDSEINLSMTVIALSNKIMTHFDNLRRNLNTTK